MFFPVWRGLPCVVLLFRGGVRIRAIDTPIAAASLLLHVWASLQRWRHGGSTPAEKHQSQPMSQWVIQSCSYICCHFMKHNQEVNVHLWLALSQSCHLNPPVSFICQRGKWATSIWPYWWRRTGSCLTLLLSTSSATPCWRATPGSCQPLLLRRSSKVWQWIRREVTAASESPSLWCRGWSRRMMMLRPSSYR